jgi:hypothetical protein
MTGLTGDQPRACQPGRSSTPVPGPRVDTFVPFNAPAGQISAQAADELITAREQMVNAAIGCLRLAGPLQTKQLVAFGGLNIAAALLELASAHDADAFEHLELAARALASAGTATSFQNRPTDHEPENVAFLAAVLILRARLIMLDAATAAEKTISLITLGDTRRRAQIGPELSVQASAIGDVHINLQVTQLPPPPQQLPQPRPLTRPLAKAAVQALHALLKEHQRMDPALPLVLVLTGPAGADVSTAALTFLHALAATADHEPATLYTDLHHTPGDQPPADPRQVLGRWLHDLGVPADQMPTGTAERAAWYRSRTQDGPLVLIDGAVSAAQVRPLLPSGPSITVITSRAVLAGLVMNGARILPFTPTTEDDQ